MNEKRNEKLLYTAERQRQEKREAIAKAIEQGKTYKAIQDELKTSTSTIASVKRMMEEDRWKQ